ncbi:hypothetical protein MKY91_20380 [Alkalicoccobacillus gibsonii]|uniref:Uncharacterized protein n=1 Tax=Alkalicoccobacillus gibsonii TaxID=79881 RepID=A0ABU9VP81_9BACI
MEKIIKLSPVISIILIFGCVFLGVTLNGKISDIKYLESELEESQALLEAEKETGVLRVTMEKFIGSSGETMRDFLTGQALLEFDSVELMADPEDLDNDTYSIADNLTVINISANKTAIDKGEAFAIYEIEYYVETPEGDYEFYNLLMSMKAEFVKTSEGYKVNNYSLDLLKDTVDDIFDTNEEE